MSLTKIQVARLFMALGLGLSVAFLLNGCVDDQQSSNLKGSPPYTKPTWSGDDHVNPVYTSPAIAPTTTNLSEADADP
jgi:hypothetical protein